MKKFLLFLLLVISSLLCVATHEVSAFETAWYNVAANEINNPVLLEDEEYFQGISINSNIISDLTYLQIPFEKYLYKEEKLIQVIAFAEALYTDNDEVENEIVLYLYNPYCSNDMKSIKTKMSIESVKILDPAGIMLEVGSKSKYEHEWNVISNFGSLSKMSFSISTKDKPSVKKILLSDYDLSNTMTSTILSTIFDFEILEMKTIYSSEKITRDSLLKSNKLMYNQQFNFIYEKSVDHPEAVALLSNDIQTVKTHHFSSIAYNETTAKAEGKMIRLRYKTKEIEDLNLFNGEFATLSYDGEFTDFFYYFFNVSDAATGKSWTGDEKLSCVKYTYVEYLAEACNIWESILPGLVSGSNNVTAEVRYLDKNGNIVFKDSFSNRDMRLNNFDDIPYRDKTELESIYQIDTIDPSIVYNKYPKDTFYNNVMDWVNNDYKLYTAKLPTLFRTSDKEFVNNIDANLTETVKMSDYQFGLMIAGKGYPVTQYEDHKNHVVYGYSCIKSSQYTADLVEINEIYYEYLGEKCHATVLETTVDDSDINNPYQPGDDEEPPFHEDPPPREWWEEILEWLKKAYEWLKENYKVLLFWGGVILGVVFIYRLVSKILDFKSKKAIIETANQQKKKE